MIRALLVLLAAACVAQQQVVLLNSSDALFTMTFAKNVTYYLPLALDVSAKGTGNATRNLIIDAGS